MDLNARRELCATEGVTLDGQRAKITGAQLEFAHVTTLDGRLSAEFAWSTVERIVKRDAAFKF